MIQTKLSVILWGARRLYRISVYLHGSERAGFVLHEHLTERLGAVNAVAVFELITETVE